MLNVWNFIWPAKGINSMQVKKIKLSIAIKKIWPDVSRQKHKYSIPMLWTIFLTFILHLLKLICNICSTKLQYVKNAEKYDRFLYIHIICNSNKTGFVSSQGSMRGLNETFSKSYFLLCSCTHLNIIFVIILFMLHLVVATHFAPHNNTQSVCEVFLKDFDLRYLVPYVNICCKYNGREF